MGEQQDGDRRAEVVEYGAGRKKGCRRYFLHGPSDGARHFGLGRDAIGHGR